MYLSAEGSTVEPDRAGLIKVSFISATTTSHPPVGIREGRPSIVGVINRYKGGTGGRGGDSGVLTGSPSWQMDGQKDWMSHASLIA